MLRASLDGEGLHNTFDEELARWHWNRGGGGHFSVQVVIGLGREAGHPATRKLW